MSAADEALGAALNLARNRGWRVFPVGQNKHPARSHYAGGHGYQDAANDPDQIRWLWLHWPGPYIGIATGELSGFDVLDVDHKHLPDSATPEQIATRDAAAWWWIDNYHRIPLTRAFASQSNGTHLYFNHHEGLRNSAGRINRGIDVRADGGYVVYWFAAGYPCRDHSPIADWPAWLLAAASRPEPKPEPISRYTGPITDALSGIVRTVAEAQVGERNAMLFWAACRLAERGVNRAEAEAMLLPAVPPPNDPRKDRGTIASAYRVGRAA